MYQKWRPRYNIFRVSSGRAFTQKGRIFGSFQYLQSLNPITAIWVLIYSQLYRSIGNVTSNPPLKIHAHGDMMPFKVLCAIRTRLSNGWWFHCMLLFVQLLASRSLSRCIATWHGSSFVVKSGKTQKVPTIWQIFKVSTHGCSFTRLWYLPLMY